jgi:hypothetical protein
LVRIDQSSRFGEDTVWMGAGMKRRLLVAILIPTLLIAVATVVVTGAVLMGTVAFHLDKETYGPSETVTITLRSLRTGKVQFGTPFEVQRFEDGNWVEVPLDRLWTFDIIVLLAGKAVRQSFIPAEDFFETPKPGRYRVVKEIQVGRIHYGATLETQTLHAEFHIETLISEQHGT